MHARHSHPDNRVASAAKVMMLDQCMMRRCVYATSHSKGVLVVLDAIDNGCMLTLSH